MQLGQTLTPGRHDPVLREVVRRLAEVYSPFRIYLFGPAARGDAGPDSDYDLMVIIPDDAPSALRQAAPGYAALRGLGIAKDVLVSTRTNFDKQLHLRASLPATIVREGALIYGG